MIHRVATVLLCSLLPFLQAKSAFESSAAAESFSHPSSSVTPLLLLHLFSERDEDSQQQRRQPLQYLPVIDVLQPKLSFQSLQRSKIRSNSRARLLVADHYDDTVECVAEEDNGAAQEENLMAPPPSSVLSLSFTATKQSSSSSYSSSKLLLSPSSHHHSFTSTGTTIVGLVAKDCVVLAADTRATAGRLVADKQADKIHRLTPTIYACGAGTSADLLHVTRKCEYRMRFLQAQQQAIGQDFNNNDLLSPSTVEMPFGTVCRFLQQLLYSQNGNIGANLIVGGVSGNQTYLRAIHPHGSMDILESFTALGSGGMAAMAVLESGYHTHQTAVATTTTTTTTPSYNMITRDRAVELATRAIVAGIENDLGSGSQVDVVVIYVNGTVEEIRAAVPEQVLVGWKKNETAGASSEENATTGSAIDNTSVVAGVNGFGNVPFAIRSQRTVQIHIDTAQEQWDRILGLSED